LEDSLHPLVNYFIVPLFAFANAGIFLLNMDPASVFEGVSLAIICGLFFGKFLGIFSFSWLCIKLKLAPMPARSTWNSFAAVSMLGGIGFTVSLFIATLSFPDASQADLLNHAKLGIVVGSIISGVVGYIWLHFALPKAPAEDEENE
ncbi:MAG: Na+/H+ antiporter NhaA, partial [Muribaculaceae bacterium]|nr:Na+/H+ antiporter NhaA [Muribaculaceae bacterium]